MDTVVLLHGHGRTRHSMRPLARRLRARGWQVANLGYPSTSSTLDELVAHLHEELEPYREERLHFVTHSMGGILLRAYLAAHPIMRLGRVVMLSPPNAGSEVVDRLTTIPVLQHVVRRILGPAGVQLGTGERSLLASLPPPAFELGIVAGTRSMNPLFARLLPPGPHDGTVSVARMRVPGMRDFIEVPCTHTFIMRSAAVAEQVSAFLETGAFRHTP